MNAPINSSVNFESKNSETKTVVQSFDHILYLAWSISLQKVSHLKQEKVINQSFQATTNFGDYDDLFECDSFNLESHDIYECFSFLTGVVSVENFHEEVHIN